MSNELLNQLTVVLQDAEASQADAEKWRLLQAELANRGLPTLDPVEIYALVVHVLDGREMLARIETTAKERVTPPTFRNKRGPYKQRRADRED